MVERRANERYSVWFPMTVITDDGEEGTAITFDVSAKGVLIACAGSLDEGAHVRLRFVLQAEGTTREVPGRVLRVEVRGDESGPWRYRMAVEYDEVQPDLEALLQAEAAAQD